MTADAKVGLLLGLVFIIIIAFLINGLPQFLEGGRLDSLQQTARIPPSEPSILLPGDVEEAMEPIGPRRDVAPRQIAPPDKNDPILTQSDRRNEGSAASRDDAQSVGPGAESAQPSKPRTYTVEAGDNLAVIAKKIWGEVLGNKQATVKKLYEANRDILASEHVVLVGQTLAIPDLFTEVPSAPVEPVSNPAPGLLDWFMGSDPKKPDKQPTYQVKKDETLWEIAEKRLGNGNRWQDIVDLNKDLKDPHAVPVGTVLKLPQS